MSRKSLSMGSRPSVDYRLVSIASHPDLSHQHQTIGGAAWPEFLLHDPVPMKYWDRLMAYFPECQLSLVVDGAIAAVANAVPLFVDTQIKTLPDRGVDWGVEKSVSDYENGITPNTLMGLQVVVHPNHRSKGLSVTATLEMKKLAARQGLQNLLLPVRPVDKPNFPLIPMKEYISWTNDRDEPFDRWLRIHNRLNGEVIGICSESMIIPGSINDWSRWTKQAFPGSGQYIVEGALNPIEVDIDTNRGIYREPNIWVVYHTDS